MKSVLAICSEKNRNQPPTFTRTRRTAKFLNALKYAPALALSIALAMPMAAQTSTAANAALPGHVLPALSRATLKPHTPEMDEEQIKLTVVLGLSDAAGAEAFKQQFEDPNSPTFHETIASSEYTARFGPTEEAYNAVLSYLEENGLSLVLGSKNRRTITIQGTRAQAQKAFHVSIDDYELGSRSFHAIASDPALPANIALFVVSIFGLSNLGQMHPASTPQALTPMAATFAYNGALTPAGKTNAGGLPPGLDGSGQIVGLLELDGFDFSDVKDWLKFAHLPSSLIDHLSYYPVDGGQTPSGCTQEQAQCGTTEALLDIEAALGTAQGASVVVYTAPSSDDVAEALNYAGNDMSYGHGGSLSTSWYTCEGEISASDATGIDSIVYDDEFFGITVFAATGDNGGNCVVGGNTYAGGVSFPADASNVVAVGGTTLNTNADGSYNSESWWQNAGGFGVSQYIAKPWYQDTLYPSAGHRSVPDVVMESTPGLVVCQAEQGSSPNCGDSTTIGSVTIFHNVIVGTSLASPLFAATYAIANQALEDSTASIVSAGGSFFYMHPGGFHSASSFIGPGNDFAHVGLGSPDITKLIAKIVPPRVDAYSPENGPAGGGTKITITGAGFIGVEKVTFGGVDGTHLTIDSDTRLTVETPEAPGQFATIKVETPGGTATAAALYTYNPEITGVSPSSGPMQGGASVTISGLALSSSQETFIFGEAKATGVSCPTPKKCTMYTPANAPGTVAVEATTPWGYGYSPITKETEYTYQGPAITSFTPTYGPTTGGEMVQLYGNSLGPKTKVMFGTVPATGVHCPDPSYCYMNNPPQGVGKVKLTLVVDGITSAAAKDEFDYLVFPTVTGISTNKGGPPTTVTFTGTGFSTTPGQTQFNFFGIPVEGTCSSTTQCTAIPVPDVDGSATSTEVTVTVNGITSLDSVLYSEGTKPIPPNCKPGTCS